MSDASPDHRSAISPGLSWYETTCGERPAYSALDDNISCDVAIVGGGFCGLSTALHLAKGGTNVALLDGARFGDGASGRNGGQMGSGQRAGVLELEAELGFDRAKALWDMAEGAKRSLHETAAEHGYKTDYLPGQLTPMHRQRYEKEAREEVEALSTRFDYDAIEYLDADAMASALGSTHYFGGTRDSGTGHVHPMKIVIGLAKAASKAGAKLFENSAAIRVSRESGRFVIRTEAGAVVSDKCLLAVNGHHKAKLHPALDSHVMPIQSFIGATAPLGHNSPVLPGKEAVDDSRFVVRYFRRTADDRLLFGGREAYGKATPGDIERTIRNQIAEIYPDLADIELTHAWGGNVAITMPRMPFVRELEPGLWTAGGFSG
ncbi:MAG: FAD-binding oxidoreductase, partial [Pseudomonadota bacterium]